MGDAVVVHIHGRGKNLRHACLASKFPPNAIDQSSSCEFDVEYAWIPHACIIPRV